MGARYKRAQFPPPRSPCLNSPTESLGIGSLSPRIVHAISPVLVALDNARLGLSSLNPEAVDLFSVSAHKMTILLQKQGEPVFSALMRSQFADLAADLIISPPSPAVLLSALELLYSFLFCPSPIVTRFMLEKENLFPALSAVLASDDLEAVYFTLKIVQLNAYDFIEMKIRFLSVYDFPFDRIRSIFAAAPRGSPIQRALLLACRFICDSERFGRYCLEIAIWLTAVFEEDTDPAVLFPVLRNLVKNYADIVRETPPLLDFLLTRMGDFVRAGAVRSSHFALKLYCQCIKSLPDLAVELEKQVSIEDLVSLLESGSQKLAARILEFLALRCADGNSDWVFSLLFDARIDEMLRTGLLEGSYRLKRAVLEFSRLVLQYSVEPERVALLVNPDFLSECIDFLGNDMPRLHPSILRFLEIVPRKTRQGDVEGLLSLIHETGLVATLEEMALADEELAPLARAVLIELHQLFESQA
jgi:hypothetical protein